MRALAHLELGNIDAAMPYLRSHVANGRTGRFPGQANDSVLLLAAHARAEGDDPRARELLLSSWFCRTDATIIYSHELARRLDVVEEHERCQRRARHFRITQPGGYQRHASCNGGPEVRAHAPGMGLIEARQRFTHLSSEFHASWLSVFR